jgi:hypothetical protein
MFSPATLLPGNKNHKKFKALCDELQMPYRYVELPTALKDFLTA